MSWGRAWVLVVAASCSSSPPPPARDPAPTEVTPPPVVAAADAAIVTSPTVTAADIYNAPLAQGPCQHDADCTLTSRLAGACPQAALRRDADQLRAKVTALCAAGGPQDICGPMPGCVSPASGAVCNSGTCAVPQRVAVAPPPARTCKRERQTTQTPCSGIERPPVQVTACDGCTSNADCKARPRGRCEQTGGGMCEPPAAFVCRYPGDVCDGCKFCLNDGNGAAICEREQRELPSSVNR